jgi:cytochrome c oxidase assembly protein Cox11
MDTARKQHMERRNRRTLLAALTGVAGMVGVSFAAVPLYNLFCRVTGFNGTPMIGGAAAPGAGEQVMNVRFNANTQPDLPWRFAPATPSIRLRVGEEGVAFYNATSTGERPSTGISTYNVTPEVVGKYFHKTACFCFEEQPLAPGAARRHAAGLLDRPGHRAGPEHPRHPHHHRQLHLLPQPERRRARGRAGLGRPACRPPDRPDAVTAAQPTSD